MITRRTFLKTTCAGGALLGVRTDEHPIATVNRPALDPNLLPKFVDPLPIPGVARCCAYRSAPGHPGVKLPFYRVEMRQFWTKVHRDLKPTRMWGFDSAFPGPTFETRSGQGFLVEWVNSLPPKHFLPVDYRLRGAKDRTPGVKAVVHLHGARVQPDSDGSPEDWYRPGRSALCHYPNHQDAATLWYHDHVMGTNRLNSFAGLLGMCIIRDHVDDALNLPKGKYELPLVICDRLFDQDGQLNYPAPDRLCPRTQVRPDGKIRSAPRPEW